MSTFDKIFVASVGLLMALILLAGVQGMRELNDGRVHTVVTQIVRGGAQ